MSVDAFFAYARERHATYLRRSSGRPREEWTSDPILRAYRFCNVFRELDRTTIWFREAVREPLRDKPDVLLATVLFRWFNRITTGEALFVKKALGHEGEEPHETAWQAWNRLKPEDAGILRASVLEYCDDGPYVTGSYIIKTPDGKSKLDGVLWCIEQFTRLKVPMESHEYGWELFADTLLEQRDAGQPVQLKTVWAWLRQFPFLGDFTAYEIVTDLRHTALLDRAPDIMTWANPGPGAMRGLNRIVGRPLTQKIPKEAANKEMRALLEYSRNPAYWPTDWPAWEMREVEHTLCEHDKHQRALHGQGRPRQVFR